MEKVVFFDLDGTVLDTLEDIADCLNDAFEHFGYEKYPYAVIRKSVGFDCTEIVRSILNYTVSVERAMEIWDYYMTIVEVKGTEKTKVFDGMAEVIAQLKLRGYKLCAFTNKTEDELAPFIPRFLDELKFDKISAVGGTDRSKPSPKEVINTVTEYGASLQNCYLVGDGETDVLTAINAGITPVAVLWGNRSKEQLQVVGAKLFASQPKQLLDLIN